MANELVYAGDPQNQTGLTLEAKVYGPLPGTVTQVGTDQAATESGSTAIYRANMPTASAGVYLVRFHNTADDSLMGQSTIGWDGAAEIGLDLILGVIETGYSPLATQRLMAAVLLGKIDDAGTTTNTFRSMTDAKDRVTATVDTSGNRTAITLDGT